MSPVPEALVRKKLDAMLARCEEEKRRPSVLALARELGMSNTTFRRNFPDVTAEISRQRTTPVSPAAGARNELDRLAFRNSKLRRRNHELTGQLKLAVAQIQFLAHRAAQLEQALETQANVTNIADRR
ncbi:hypothetical protein [Streptomyces rubiginosohelvolus]|uniref:hypothetical protein n=1 Tax=Streptomyces rubiginosohelvolus TaxID=67362 RepID=UPI0033FF496E